MLSPNPSKITTLHYFVTVCVMICQFYSIQTAHFIQTHSIKNHNFKSLYLISYPEHKTLNKIMYKQKLQKMQKSCKYIHVSTLNKHKIFRIWVKIKDPFFKIKKKEKSSIPDMNEKTWWNLAETNEVSQELPEKYLKHIVK